MHLLIRFLGAVLLAAGLSGFLLAQSAPDSQALADAAVLRGEMVVHIVSGSETPEAALSRLRALNSPSGLGMGGRPQKGSCLTFYLAGVVFKKGKVNGKA